MKFLYFTIVSCALLIASSAAMATPKLESDSALATAGYYQLRWSDGDGKSFVLEESEDPAFKDATKLYQGADSATLVSGRPNGTYYYRIRAAQPGNTWSDTVKVVVTHHPLSRALLFFVLGALVFLATLTVVIRGNLTHKNYPD